MQAKSTTTPE